jgi:hypothetical protein
MNLRIRDAIVNPSGAPNTAFTSTRRPVIAVPGTSCEVADEIDGQQKESRRALLQELSRPMLN